MTIFKIIVRYYTPLSGEEVDEFLCATWELAVEYLEVIKPNYERCDPTFTITDVKILTEIPVFKDLPSVPKKVGAG